jgi:hypothetical protein
MQWKFDRSVLTASIVAWLLEITGTRKSLDAY